MITLLIAIWLTMGLWLTWAYIQGKEEAIFTVAKRNSSMGDQHTFWTYQRMVVGGLVVLPLILLGIGYTTVWITIFYAMLLSIASILTFPIIHDGSFFINVNKFDEVDDLSYPDGFWQDKDSKAKFDFTANQRIIMSIMGFLILGFLSIALIFNFAYPKFNVMGLDLLVVAIIIIGFFIYKLRNRKKE